MAIRMWCGALSILVAAVAGSTAGAADLTTDLVFHFNYDDGANLYADSSGNGYDGIKAGYPLMTEDGMVGFAADFVDEQTSSSYSYFDITDVPPSEVPTSAVTVAYWCKIDRFYESGTEYNGYSSSKERNTIISTMAAPNGQHGTKGTGGITSDLRGVTPTNWAEPAWSASFRTCIRGHDIPGERNQHPIVDYTYGWAEDEFITVEQATDKWFHLAVTYDKATASSALYLNGEKVKDLPVIEAIDIEPEWYKAHIGRFTEGGREFRGTMDELYLFSRALSEEDIEYLAQPRGDIPGDLNSDAAVNSGDLNIVRANWREPGPIGDCDGDGMVMGSDLDVVRANWGFALADLRPVPGPVGVPEPGAFVFASFGIGMVLVLRRVGGR